MKPIKGFEAKAQTEFKKLPAGAYKIKIMGVKYQDNSNHGYSDQLILQFDIEEGEFKGFYTEQYNNNTAEDKKYKGTYRIYLPNDDGSEKDGWTKSKFESFIYAFQESNKGYVWNWDEQTLKGLVVGAIFNLKEYDYNGKNGFFTNLYKIIPISDISTAKIPEPTFLNGGNGGNSGNSDFLSVNGAGTLDEIPFN